ncbi:MAG: methyltransferase domain-containing protein [Deltaproteobacteria bacterium]|nr:methyltransferase domain-containing protein [Deltaproteobacteria bacterium]
MQPMGLIFDKKTAAIYEDWYQSAQGRAIDRAMERLIANLAEPIPGERVLDIGCGTGNHLIIMSKLGLDVAGIDYSPYMIKAARERLGHRCELKTAPAEDLPYEDNEFHTSFLINTLEFLDNPLAALREAGRVSKNRVFVGVFNSLSWNGLVKRGQGYLGNALYDGLKFYNLWQLRFLLKQAFGDAVVTWGSIGSLPEFQWQKRLFSKAPGSLKRSPFGIVLGMSVTMRYRFTTQGLPLKVGLKKAPGRSLAGPAGMKVRGQKAEGGVRSDSGTAGRAVSK